MLTPIARPAAANIRIGDVIERVGGTVVRDTLDFLLNVGQFDGALELHVRDDGAHVVQP